MSIYEWKEDVALTYTEILFSHENEGKPTIWDAVSAKWDEPDKGKYCVKSLICGISQSIQSWTHRNSRKVAARGCKIGKYGDVGKRVQDSNYKMKKARGPNIKDGDYRWSHCTA